MNIQQELESLAERYAQHTLPVCVYGGDHTTIKKWVEKIAKKSACETVVIDDLSVRSLEGQKEMAVLVQKNDQKKRFVFITPHSPYELEKKGELCRELAIQLSILPVEI